LEAKRLKKEILLFKKGKGDVKKQDKHDYMSPLEKYREKFMKSKTISKMGKKIVDEDQILAGLDKFKQSLKEPPKEAEDWKTHKLVFEKDPMEQRQRREEEDSLVVHESKKKKR